MIYIVGVGIAEGQITERAARLIEEAEVVYGSKKAIELAKKHIKGKSIVIKKFDGETYREIENVGKEKNVVVLSTGDPMVSGLGTKIKGVVEPGISSVQLALARLGVDLCEVAIVSAHAREAMEEIKALLRCRGKVIILADSKFDIVRLSRIARKIVVMENLGMKNERIDEKLEIRSDNVIVYAEGGGRLKGLIIVGHGSKLPYYREVMDYHKERIRQMGIFDEVEIAFAAHRRKPTVDEVVKKMESSVIYLVPLFMAYGVHTTEELPEKLGLEFKEGVIEGEFEGKKVILCEPVGKDDFITYAILNRVFSAKSGSDGCK
ncbi:cobalt-precorrin-7 (C(5))-methyltransferase [Archaeoglobus veneficus]|uniref:Precorrin-6y C5,15-methyltransferase (Decarboxylating), CbiE subunit n=1 Tax=Archaeoglobus veneficus (strain DSM 11195 / SNP6) TaxID=693661 RepID=F2KRZ8_ARCVS|nr:cobalt-precorrin-7 (C(5))-methyltransferase [Archaeoglobus veneficus]AEA46839.1 precorrin-6y C5,15-methyltransferase (decarboxylating), CbiE subunit [Archaeoglobus veneficus SNP6]